MLDLLQKVKIYGLSRSLRYALVEVYKIIWMGFFRKSYSQQGEDLIIDQLLINKEGETGFCGETGFYVDVGAHDPTRFSNTKRFYDKGWSGINIDPNPVLIRKFETQRKRDRNLALGIGIKEGALAFYEFFPSTISTISSKEAVSYKRTGFKLISKNKVPVRTLRSVLKEYSKGKKIDFLSIDTEGTDLEVLQSNDWNNFKPKVICVETKGNFDKITTFLKKYDYKLKYTNGINSILSV